MTPPKNLHRLLAVLTVAASIGISILTPATGIYAHWHWAPVVLGLLTNIKALLPAPPITGFSLALVLAALTSLSCAHVQHVVSCAGHDVSEADVARVWNDVATGNDADLIAEAATVGWDVVSCVIADLEQRGKLTHEQAKHGQSVRP